jgi:hypothetical protein
LVPRAFVVCRINTNLVQAGSLDNISRRYSWFNRMMKTYDVEHASIFPAYWKVNEMLANSYCEGTREDFKTILQRSMRRTEGQTLDVDLLLSCLQETLDFEHSLEKRFSNEVSKRRDEYSIFAYVLTFAVSFVDRYHGI